MPKYSIEDRLRQFGTSATQRLEPHFLAARTAFPPHRSALIAFKDQCRLELHAACNDAPWRLVRAYRILAASGKLGPKLQEGDRQVPEGVYRITLLNANSKFHVSLRLDYPNALDREMALADGRTDLGCDIMIHGRSASIGCLAVGDAAAEELFTLAAAVKPENITVIIAPSDLRTSPAAIAPGMPSWTSRLYAELREALAPFSESGSVLLH
jgi:L,D-transpeptidase-like protein